jgi:2-methylcitrate dehydratase PrpD
MPLGDKMELNLKLNRRELLGSGLALLATAHAEDAIAQNTKPGAGAPAYGAATLGLGITSTFARFLSGIQFDQLSPAAVHEAKRAVLDWIGCALAGSRHPTAQKLLATFAEIGSLPVSTVLGHVLDFDDTHLGGVILHTSTATLPALFALGERRKSSGRDLMVALAAAFEAGIRVGQAAPRHHFGGWHLTGTLGTIAATAGSARLIGLDDQQTTYALGIGCTQAAGMQQNRGSDCKSLHAGNAAYHGVLAAMLASNGFNSSPEILEGSLGFVKIFSSTQQIDAITAGLGQSWKITGNGYKPYACGIVLHPLIDAMIEVSRQANQPAGLLDRVEVLVHPDVIRITGVDTPGTGLMSKFSSNHAAAVAYIDQAAGVSQFSNERASDPAVQALRKLIQIKTVPSFRLDQAAATVFTKSGAKYEARIEHATGTISNPMSDQALSEKFLGNATMAISTDRARRVADLIWRLDSLKDVGDLVRACA